MRTTFVLLAAVAMPAAVTQAQVFTFGGLNLNIPDSEPSGIFDERSITSPYDTITHVAVTLTISGLGSGAFNGDLYVTLAHIESGPGGDSYLTVLVNRAGRRAADDLGYADNGISITLDDTAGIGDVHNYRLVLNASHGVALPGSLSGLWQADGRAIDPASSGAAFDAASRTAGLGGLNGMDPNGTWRLFAADVGEFSGGTARLDGWSLEISGDLPPIPEPAETAGVIGLGLGLFAVWRRRR